MGHSESNGGKRKPCCVALRCREGAKASRAAKGATAWEPTKHFYVRSAEIEKPIAVPGKWGVVETKG